MGLVIDRKDERPDVPFVRRTETNEWIEPASTATVEMFVEQAARTAELEAFAKWAKQHATAQAKACRDAGVDDMPWCKVVDQAEAALTK